MTSTQEKYMMKRTHACNLEILIEETLSLWKARANIKENSKILKYENIKIANNCSNKSGKNLRWYLLVRKIIDISTFILYDQFEIIYRSWFTFLIGNFTVVLTRIFFADWEHKFLKQIGPHRYLSRNWCKNESALGIKNLHQRNFFNWVKSRLENGKPIIY